MKAKGNEKSHLKMWCQREKEGNGIKTCHKGRNRMLLGGEGKEEGVDGWMDGRMDKTGRSLITGAKGKGELHDEMGKTEECSF